ncbi:anti-sigma factor RsbA family regulatory protein [Prauserella endophytica]
MTTIRDMDAGAFIHPALFYRDESTYLAGTVPFVLDGLAGGEPVAVAVPGRNLARIEDALGDAAGEVLLIDMGDAGRNPGRIIPGVLRAFADAHPGPVRIIGEPIWAGRSEDEYPACAQHEALINAAFAGREATILCPYDTTSLAASVLADAEATHPLLIDDIGQTVSERYSPDDIVATYNAPLSPSPAAAAMTFTVSELARVRHFAFDFAADAGLPGERLQDLVLAVGELTGNSVQHGGGGGELRLWAEGGHLVCEVEDSGQLADPLAGRRPVPLSQVGGRGLLLVNHIADLVRTYRTDSGTITRVYLRLP